MSTPVIVLEFNELTPSLIDRFIGDGDLPGFARLRGESTVCVTDAQESAPNLEPWIQWVTVHTGLSFAEHRVFLLGEGAKLTAPRIWDVVADAGERAWVCGSMNSAVTARLRENLYVLPDPWALDIQPCPAGLFEDYFTFVRTQVQEYTRDKPPLSVADYLRFFRFMARAGLSPRTIADTVRQLAGELERGTRWRRAAILDRLQWDVFRHFYRKLRPTFSTFFVNSTAHFQHFYWRDMEPHKFRMPPQSGRDAGAADAIRFGYQRMDRIVEECLTLAGDDATVVLCTALSGQPLLKYDAEGGKQIVRVSQIEHILSYLGVEGQPHFAPVMSEEFHLRFESESAASDAETRLTSMTTESGEQVLAVSRQNSDLLCGVKLLAMPAAGTKVTSRFGNQARLFADFFYLAQGAKSGMHHPDGVLWIRTAARRPLTVTRKVPLREVAPTLLALTGVDTPHLFSVGPMPELQGASAGRTRERTLLSSMSA